MKKQRTLNEKELLFIWKAINELRACLNNQIEAGAEGADKYSDDGWKAMKLINKERLRIIKGAKK